MRIRDIVIAMCVTVLILVGGRVFLEKNSREDSSGENKPLTEITEYTAIVVN